MQWLVSLVLAVAANPRVRSTARAFLLAVLAAASAALGLGALLPPGLLPFGS